MGLGPPVCEKCKVIAMFDVDTDHWACPICDNTKCRMSYFNSEGLTQEDFDNNERFLRFVTGRQKDDT